MKQKNIILAIACIVGVITYGNTQEIIFTGKVQTDSNAVGGATVEVRKAKKNVIADSTGNFVVNLLAGTYTFVISAVGFEPLNETITVNATANNKIFQLVTNTSALDEVVVSGTMKPVQRKESPILVEVYSPAFLKKNPAPSLFESLQNVNGVRPQLNCNVCSTGDIHINGLEGPYTMITIDGMPIVSSLSSVYGLFGIPSQLIERVEIVKGPASGLYGSEAIGGLINIITKNPDKAPRFTANVMATNWQEYTVDAGMKWKLAKRITGLTGVNYFNYQRPEDKNEDFFTDVTLQHRISLFNKLSLQRKNNRVATLAARYFYEDRWGGDIRWNKTFRGGDSLYGESIYTSRWELIGNYQLPVDEKIFLSFSATDHNQNSYYGTTPYFARQKIVFGQLTWDKNIGEKNTALLGAALRYNNYDDNSTATFDTLSKTNKEEQYWIPGIFVQNEWKINKQHQLLFGLRYDYHSVHKSIITPRVAYKWSLSDKQVIRINAGTGFRVVSLFTEEHAALTGARAVEVKEELKPEKSYNANLNYSNQWRTGNTVLNFDVSAWYTFFYNQIIPDYTTDLNKIIYQNLDGHAISKGLSMNIEGSISRRIKALAGFTLQDVAKFEKNAAGNKVKQLVLLTEKWSGTWALTYLIPANGISIDYTGNVYGPMHLPLASETDPRRSVSPVWSIQNIQITKKFSPAVEIYGGIKNLLNWTPSKNNPFIIARSHDPFDKEVQFDNNGKALSTPSNPYGLTFDPSYVFAPNQGMRFFAGVRFVIN